MNKRSKMGALLALALLVPVTAQAETTCTGAVRNIPGNMIFFGNSERTRQAAANYSQLRFPSGTPVCGYIGFNNADSVSEEHMREAGAGALHFVCDTPGMLESMRGEYRGMQVTYAASGTCTLDDGAVITWYVRPLQR